MTLCSCKALVADGLDGFPGKDGQHLMLTAEAPGWLIAVSLLNVRLRNDEHGCEHV
jgi:hypothetical protein